MRRPGHARAFMAVALVCVLAAVPASPARAQSSPSAAKTQAQVNGSSVPEPYRDGEFPPWVTGLRRFEIVSLGAFPILLFYARFGFDLKRYIENGFSAAYAPWPFKSETSYKPTDDEQIQGVLTAAALSLAFGTLDAIFVWRLSLDS